MREIQARLRNNSEPKRACSQASQAVVHPGCHRGHNDFCAGSTNDTIDG